MKLTRQIAELTSKMNTWEQRQPAQLSMQSVDLQSIIAATTKAVLELMNNGQENQNPSNNRPQQPTAGGVNNSNQSVEDIGMLNIGIDTLSFNFENSIDSNMTDKPNDKPP